MSLMDYLKQNKLWLICSLLILLVTNAVFFSSLSYNGNLVDIFYMDLLIITGQISFMAIGYLSQKNRYRDFNAGTARVNKDYHLNLLQNNLKLQQKQFLHREEEFKRNINEIQDYVTQWVHDTKVSLAACELLLENNGGESDSELAAQIEKIKFSVQQMLHSTRANHYELDVTAEPVQVTQEIRMAIKENALFFISKNIEISAHLLEFTVISDRKWIRYCLSQILNNASKYTPENGKVEIWTEESDRAYYVHIKDNGIGIPPEDAGRIFDKGFTGKNGRIGVKSTGMGLYYVNKICRELRIGIEAKSEEGQGTEFIFAFYKLSDYYQLTNETK